MLILSLPWSKEGWVASDPPKVLFFNSRKQLLAHEANDRTPAGDAVFYTILHDEIALTHPDNTNASARDEAGRSLVHQPLADCVGACLRQSLVACIVAFRRGVTLDGDGEIRADRDVVQDAVEIIQRRRQNRSRACCELNRVGPVADLLVFAAAELTEDRARADVATSRVTDLLEIPRVDDVLRVVFRHDARVELHVQVTEGGVHPVIDRVASREEVLQVRREAECLRTAETNLTSGNTLHVDRTAVVVLFPVISVLLAPYLSRPTSCFAELGTIVGDCSRTVESSLQEVRRRRGVGFRPFLDNDDGGEHLTRVLLGGEKRDQAALRAVDVDVTRSPGGGAADTDLLLVAGPLAIFHHWAFFAEAGDVRLVGIDKRVSAEEVDGVRVPGRGIGIDLDAIVLGERETDIEVAVTQHCRDQSTLRRLRIVEPGRLTHALVFTVRPTGRADDDSVESELVELRLETAKERRACVTHDGDRVHAGRGVGFTVLECLRELQEFGLHDVVHVLTLDIDGNTRLLHQAAGGSVDAAVGSDQTHLSVPGDTEVPPGASTFSAHLCDRVRQIGRDLVVGASDVAGRNVDAADGLRRTASDGFEPFRLHRVGTVDESAACDADNDNLGDNGHTRPDFTKPIHLLPHFLGWVG
ncbi:MAG: hypothetical protein RLZZ480_161 [Candidatus Parcubacteria bacterium]